MAGVLRIQLLLALSVMLAACSSLSQAPDTIAGNNTGGVIPPKMAATQNVEALASTHCAKWGSNARITFPASQTGGEVVFVCEKPGQAPIAPAKSEPPVETRAPTKRAR